jgi:hypothetical protein
MTWGLVAVAGATLVTGYMGAEAAGDAASAQAGASAAGIAEQRRQFDAIQKLLQPYVEAGTPALQQQQALLGLRGAGEQQAAISAIEQSPQFAALTKQGEEALLQRASATGGLRGGNIQAALAQFRPQLLSSLIEQQYSKLGGMTALGQQSAAGVGPAGSVMGTNVANLLGQQGAAQAAGALGQAQAYGQTISGLSNVAGQYFGRQALANQNIASQFGTTPGSQQTAMLQAQTAGF